jgi:hypothetical protein
MPAMRSLALILAAALLGACAAGTTTSQPRPTPKASPVAGGLTAGLIAYRSAQGIGVLDPNSGKQVLVVPISGQQFRIAGPVWGPSARAGAQALYFTLHDDRVQESARSDGVVAYDWIFRADPFTGALEPIAAAPDQASEGPVNLVGGPHELAYTVGCCGDYSVSRMRFASPPEPPRALQQLAGAGSIYVEGISPLTGWLVVRSSGGSWAWYEPDGGTTQELNVGLKADDGPIAISEGDRLAAISGGKVQTADLKAGGQFHSLPSGMAAVSLDWGPESRLALANGGGLTVIEAAVEGATPAPPSHYLAGTGVSAVSWSEAMPGLTLAGVKPVPGPQALVDGLQAATRLPAGDVSVGDRARTKVYVWRLDLKQPGAATSQVATVTKVTPAFLAQHPPLAASVLWHHWSAADWLLGGCYRYRVLVTWPSGSVASTMSLGDPKAC